MLTFFLLYYSTGVIPSLFEGYLAQMEFWPAVQEQLVIQSLTLDMQLSVLGLFTGKYHP